MTLSIHLGQWLEELQGTTLAWLWAITIIAAAAAAGFLIATWTTRLVCRWATGSTITLDDFAVEQLASPFRWAATLLAAFSVRGFLPLDEGARAVLRHAVLVLAILLVGWALARATRVVQHFIEHRFDVSHDDNLLARSAHTQMRAFGNIARFAVWLFALAFVLMTFDGVRRIGVSLLASAGLAGVVLGFAAQKSIATVFAGIQIALTQPIRVDDVVIVEGEWGRIEEIRLTYVVVRIWDLRRLVIPITYFIDTPFQNWTRTSSDILAVVTLHVDYSLPVEEVRQEFRRILEASPLWDRKVCSLQVTEAFERTMLIRPLCSAKNSSQAWDLRCEVREKLIAFIRDRYPECLPKARAELGGSLGSAEPSGSHGPAGFDAPRGQEVRA